MYKISYFYGELKFLCLLCFFIFPAFAGLISSKYIKAFFFRSVLYALFTGLGAK